MADQQQQYRHHPLPPSPASQQQGQQYGYSYPEEPYDYNSQKIQQQQQQPPQSLQSPQPPQPPQHQDFPQQYHQVQRPEPVHPDQPTPPQSAHQRQASNKSRSFSVQSGRSQRSSGSHPKVDSHETHAKEARRLHSKADPTMAISEAEPAAIQAMTTSTLAPLRSIQHRDSWGNAITDPDRSNPTRNRWERPLDTIRSFEAAIDGGYSRKSMVRSDSESVANFNRRNSYHGGGNNGPRFPQDSYYGGRPASMMRSDSTHMDYHHTNRSSYFDHTGHNGGGGGGHGSHGAIPGPNRRGPPRTITEPMNGHGRGDQNIYPMPHKDRSYETVTTAAGSGSSGDHGGYQTDPTSSDNSSIRRRSPPKRTEPATDYGIGFNQQSSFQPAAFDFANGGARSAGPGPSGTQHPQPYPQPNSSQMAPPPVPQKGGASGLLRKTSSVQRSDAGEKRKSWFARRFSKNS